MRNWLLLACALCQVGVLAFMVFDRESIIKNGKRIEITTAPIDPRDPFRGDFVRLRYAMNSMPVQSAQLSDPVTELKRGTVVYTVLQEEAGGAFAPQHFTDRKPENKTFIKGRLSGNTTAVEADSLKTVSIRYGIEQWFVEQGSGVAIEQLQGVRGGMQVPMHMQVAIADDGTAVLTGYRWNDIGVELVFGNLPWPNEAAVETPAESGSKTSEEPDITLIYENLSDTTLALDDSTLRCSLSLQTVGEGPHLYESDFIGCTSASAQSAILLQPEEQFEVTINLADPRWHVRHTELGTAGDLRRLSPTQLYRFVYQYEDNSYARQSDNFSLWQGTVRSQAFSGQGQID